MPTLQHSDKSDRTDTAYFVQAERQHPIDSIACIDYIAVIMSTTLTIRNLDKEVKQKLRIRAAQHQRSMEAEAREILARGVELEEIYPPPKNEEEMSARLAAVTGIWKDRTNGKSTDEIMKELRGDD